MRRAAGPAKYLVISFILLLVVASALAAPAGARTEARYELRSGAVTFGNDLYSSNSQQSLFHQQTFSGFDNESLNIDFPAFDRFSADGINNDLALGPTAVTTDGITASANILPFGLVNLAFPSISETVDQGYNASSTGFYTASFLGIPPVNYGAPPVTTDYSSINSKAHSS